MYFGFIISIQYQMVNAIIDDGADSSGCPNGYTVWSETTCKGPLIPTKTCPKYFILGPRQEWMDYHNLPKGDPMCRFGTVPLDVDTRAWCRESGGQWVDGGLASVLNCGLVPKTVLQCLTGYTVTKFDGLCTGPRKS